MKRFFLAIALTLSTTGCWHVYSVGPLVGATITVHSTDVRRQPAGEVSVDVSMDESQAISAYSLETEWDTYVEAVKVAWIGTVIFSGKFDKDQVYLVYAQGGIDIDPELRGEIAADGTDYEPKTIIGQSVVYAYGENLNQHTYGVNPIASAVSVYLLGVARSNDQLMDDAHLRASLNEGAQLLTRDIDNDGVVTWEDLLAFNMRSDMDKYIGSTSLLDAFIVASNGEMWTYGTYQAAEDLVHDAWRAARN